MATILAHIHWRKACDGLHSHISGDQHPHTSHLQLHHLSDETAHGGEDGMPLG